MKIIKLFFFVFLHIAAVVAIIIAFWPMAEWYFNNPTFPPSPENIEANPLWGVEFYYTGSLVNLLRDNFVLPNIGWGYAWFSGWPTLSSYPILQYYFIVPFTLFFSLIDAIKVWMLVSLALYFAGLYGVFYVLSRNIVLSVVLSIAGIYSVGVYGTLMWGGSLPSHATQAFFPWVLFFIILYLKSHNIRYLLFASILGGIAIWAHPQIVIAYIYPSSAILFIFWLGGMKFVKRLKSLFLYITISFLIALPFSYPSLGNALSGFVIKDSYNVASSTAAGPASQLANDVIAFHKAQPMRIFTDTNTTIFYMVAGAFLFFFVMLIITRRKKSVAYVIPFVILAIYFVVYTWMFAYGISIYHGGWYRLFWATPLWVGIFSAAFWGAGEDGLRIIFKKKHFYLVSHLIISFLVLIAAFPVLLNYSGGVRDKIIPRSNTSSAYPNILNLQTSGREHEELKKKLIPSWMNGENKQYRMYSGDQTINIWWNSLYSMPLARGYFDPPVTAKNRGYFFLTDASLSQSAKGDGEDQLVGEFHYPPDAALSNTLFFVDWYSIKYIESGPSLASYTPLPKSFNNSTYIKQDERLDFNKEKYNTGDMSLHYYEVKDEYVSPILSATNAQTLGIIASDTGYETIIRSLADMNMSSKLVIPIKLGQYIDQIKSSDFAEIDGLIVYDYNYSNKGNAYRLLNDYVKKGKKIFIDTGVEVKEATSTELPEIFPMNRSERKPLGKTWDFEIGESELMKDIDFTAFDEPIFNNEAWSIAYPFDDSDIREGSTILLKNKGKTVMIDYDVGGGKIIWSGINLPYHTIRSHNVEEVRFFKNIIEKLLNGIPVSSEPTFEAKFINPQKRKIDFQGATGVLFKEQAYPGWSAKVIGSSGSHGIKIFKAGPANPGFMYVRVPAEYSQNETNITFAYRGSFVTWFLSIVSFSIVAFLLEEILIGGRILGRLRRLVWKKAHGQVNSWWKREDE